MRKFLLASCFLAVAAPVFAQLPPPPPPPGGPHHGPDALDCAIRDGKAVKFLADAHDRLLITEAQAAAWTKFAGDVQAAVKPLGDQCGKENAMRAGESLPERLAVIGADARLKLEVTDKVAAAVAVMYAQLTPEQREEANRLASGHGHRDGGHGDGRDGPPGGPPPG